MPVFTDSRRRVIRVDGADAAQLLGDVLTGTFAAAPGPARWWALLSPQGKVQAEGLASWSEDAFWLDVDESVATAFLKRMTLYKLRAAVNIAAADDMLVVGWSPAADDAIGQSAADTRHTGLGCRYLVPVSRAGELAPDDGTRAAAFARLGILRLGVDFAADSVFPHDLGMDFLGGVDFEKGCYVGQEVVSRMQHRGTARRRPVVVEDAVGGGGPLRVGDREVGTCGPASSGRAAGIVRLDRIEDPEAVQGADGPVRLAVPEWASYRFGESGKA